MIGGRRSQFAGTVGMLQITSSRKRRFVCMALGTNACREIGSDFFDSLKQILENSLGALVFVTEIKLP